MIQEINDLIDENDELIQDEFLLSLETQIGKGAFGVVMKATDLSDNTDCAVKVN